MVSIPGTGGIREVLQRNFDRSPSGSLSRRRTPALPSGAPLSTLQKLSPQQLIALGVLSSASSAYFSNNFDPNKLFPDGQAEVTTNPDGETYGEAGIEYRIYVFPAGGSPGSVFTNGNYGPITPSVIQFQNPGFPVFNALQFDCFDSQGNPRIIGGRTAGSAYTWQPGSTARDFAIFPVANPEIEVPPNPQVPTTITYPFPVPPETATPVPETEAEQDRNDLKDNLTDLVDDLEELGDIINFAKELLTENLTCNICDLVSGYQAENRLWQNATESILQEVLEDVQAPIDTFSDIAECGIEPQVVNITGTNSTAIAQLLTVMLLNVGQIKSKLCTDTAVEIGHPEAWFASKAANLPQLILRMRESSSGHAGTPKMRDITLSNYAGGISDSQPSWTRGEYYGHAYTGNGASLQIFASTEASALSVLDQLGARCTGYRPDSKTVTRRPGVVTNAVGLSPYKALWYPNGRASGSQPAQVYNFETGQLWP